MTVKFGVVVPQGWRLDLTHIKDPIEKYELMTHYGREAERLGSDSIWLYDHFHTWPTTQLESTFACWTSTVVLSRDTPLLCERRSVG
jgi:alkanesulfonate monooxygenase SsuD/methylene tetrahydromethanopterin reductase-like flavin-dependent oxidoreductase (luciferase family)